MTEGMGPREFLEARLRQLNELEAQAWGEVHAIQGRRAECQFILSQLQDGDGAAMELPLNQDGEIVVPDEAIRPLPATGTAMPVPCDYCGAAITGKRFHANGKVYCNFGCADKDAQGRND